MVKKRGRDRIFWHSMSEPASTQGDQFWWGKKMDVGWEFFFQGRFWKGGRGCGVSYGKEFDSTTQSNFKDV
jgi:hypothetical protein